MGRKNSPWEFFPPPSTSFPFPNSFGLRKVNGSPPQYGDEHHFPLLSQALFRFRTWERLIWETLFFFSEQGTLYSRHAPENPPLPRELPPTLIVRGEIFLFWERAPPLRITARPSRGGCHPYGRYKKEIHLGSTFHLFKFSPPLEHRIGPPQPDAVFFLKYHLSEGSIFSQPSSKLFLDGWSPEYRGERRKSPRALRTPGFLSGVFPRLRILFPI